MDKTQEIIVNVNNEKTVFERAIIEAFKQTSSRVLKSLLIK